MPATRQKAKLFTTGSSQAVRLPKEFRFKGKEVYIRRDPHTGDVILSQGAAKTWEEVFRILDEADFPKDFLTDRDQGTHTEVREEL